MSKGSFRQALAVAADGVTQSRLAAEVGVSPQLISDWKRGRRQPSPAQVFALERALGSEPGGLSRHLGFVPTDADAAAVTGLTEAVRRQVTALVDELPEGIGSLIGDPSEFAGEAAKRGLALELLRIAVADFEREHGALTAEEVQRASARIAEAAASPPASAA